MAAKCAEFSVRMATEADGQEIVNFARRFFFVDEPLTIAIRLMEGGGRCTELEEYCTESLADGTSIVATAAETGEIIAISMNAVKHRSDKVSSSELPPPEGLPNTKFRNIVKLLDTADEQADVFGRFPDIASYVDIKILSVHPDWRGKGIAKQLVSKTGEVARSLGVPMVRCVCTSYYTHLAVARLGYQHVHTMPYKSFTDAEGKVVFETESPHDDVKTYVLRT